MLSLLTRLADMRYLLLLCWLIAPLAQALPPLVTADWVLRQPEGSPLVFVDIQPSAYYRQVHLQGALNAPYQRWRTTTAGVGGMLPAIPDLEAWLGGLGIAATDPLVIVATGLDAADMASAARVYWTLKVLGHGEVAVLDGGLAALAAHQGGAQRLTEQGTQRPARHYTATPDLSLLADSEATREAMLSGQQLVDARSSAEFAGVHVAGEGERPGTLPQAINLPYDWLTLNGSAQLLPVERLRALVQAVGIDAQRPQVHFCHSGNRAALSWFVSYALLGNREARLYDASMLEWAVRPDLPMVRGIRF